MTDLNDLSAIKAYIIVKYYISTKYSVKLYNIIVFNNNTN